MGQDRKHTSEPWNVKEDGSGFAAVTSDYVGFTAMQKGLGGQQVGIARMKANAARIVACVNALAGVENPGAVAELIAAARAVAAELPIDSGLECDAALHTALAALDGE